MAVSDRICYVTAATTTYFISSHFLMTDFFGQMFSYFVPTSWGKRCTPSYPSCSAAKCLCSSGIRRSITTSLYPVIHEWPESTVPCTNSYNCENACIALVSIGDGTHLPVLMQTCKSSTWCNVQIGPHEWSSLTIHLEKRESGEGSTIMYKRLSNETHSIHHTHLSSRQDLRYLAVVEVLVIEQR